MPLNAASYSLWAVSCIWQLIYCLELCQVNVLMTLRCREYLLRGTYISTSANKHLNNLPSVEERFLSHKLRWYTKISSPKKSPNNTREKILYFFHVCLILPISCWHVTCLLCHSVMLMNEWQISLHNAKTLKNLLQTVTFKISLKGKKTKIQKRKTLIINGVSQGWKWKLTTGRF